MHIYIYIHISINIWGFTDPSWWCMFGLFEVETAKCGQQPVPQLQGKGPWKPRWHHGIRECLWVFTHPRKHIDPAKNGVSGGLLLIYIYIYSWVGGFMVSNVFNVPPYSFGGPQQTDSFFCGGMAHQLVQRVGVPSLHRLSRWTRAESRLAPLGIHGWIHGGSRRVVDGLPSPPLKIWGCIPICLPWCFQRAG